MKARRSASSVSEYFFKNVAPTARAPAANSERLDWSRIGRSGSSDRTIRASWNPASRVITPSRGNSTSEITPSRYGR